MKSIIKIIFLFSFIVVSFTSCKDKDLFDAEEYSRIIKESFPVDSIDSNQNWATIGTADVSVYVNQNSGETYKVKVYNNNPFVTSYATLLASGTVTNGNIFTSTMSYPLADSVFFVTLKDKEGYMQFKTATITNGKLTGIFDRNSTSSAKTRSYSSTSATYDIPTKTAPDVSSYIDGAVELDNDNASVYGNVNKKLKLTGTWNGKIPNLSNWGDAGRTLYITGTWNVPSDQSLGNTDVIVVADGGKINIPSGVTLTSTGGGLIYVMHGGTISGAGSIVYTNGSGAAFDYNAGTISLGSLDVNGGTLYNVGTLTTTTLLGTTTGSTFINWGHIIVNGDFNGNNSDIYNGCSMTVAGKLSNNNMRIGTSAYVKVKDISTYGGSFILNNDAFLDVTGDFTIGNLNIIGPVAGDYAIVQIAKIPSMWGSGYIANNLYVSVDAFANTYTESLFEGNALNGISGNSAANRVGNGNATIVAKGNANMSIPSSECTAGYGKQDPVVVVDSNFSYRFCFEDNYPDAGDYDFNDAVITLTQTVDETNSKIIHLNVSLDAVGASKQLAAAIRLVGVSPDKVNITKVTPSTNAMIESGYPWPKLYVTGNETQTLDTMAIIPLFNDAHYAINGYIDRMYYNTSKESNNYSLSVSPKSMSYTITRAAQATANKLTATNMDVFICYGYNGNTWEVHTFPYKNVKALYDRDAADTGLYPWAIMVPSTFKYPVEYQPITVKITDETKTDTGAYSVEGHSFAGWAKNKDTNVDWYNYPVSSKVY